MMKATNHRKRHVPPGPCGIWFQAQHHPTSGTGTGTTTSQEDDAGADMLSTFSQQNEIPKRKNVFDMSFSPAWSCMQQALNWITPYLPPTMIDPTQRYHHIRPHVPPDYALLVEIQRGDYDRFDQSLEHSIVVLVSSVEAQIHIWTVELKDETGCTIQAWMEPKLVQQQLQQSQSIIRPGVVWRLNQVGMIVVQAEEERLERMLLVRGSAIVQVWTPEQYGAADSPEQQRQFLEWMEKRKALPLVGIPQNDNNDDDDDNNDDNDDDNDDDDDASGPPGDDDYLLEETRNACAEQLIPQQAVVPPSTDPESENWYDARSGRNSIRQSWDLPSKLPTNSSLSQASSRPVTQAFSQPWSRPRLDDAVVVLDETSMTATATESVIYRQEEEIRNHPKKDSQERTDSVHDKRNERTDLQGPIIPPTSQNVQMQAAKINHSNTEIIDKPDKEMAQPVTAPKKSRSPRIANNWKSSYDNSSFWNNLLEEDEDSDNDNDHPVHNPQKIMDNTTIPTPDQLQQQHVRDDSKDDVDSDVDDFCRGMTGAPSMFDVSNIGNVDLRAFSDDDDDDDGDK